MPGHNPKSALPRLSAPFSRRVKGPNHQPAASAEPEATSGHEWTYAGLLCSFTRRTERTQERLCDQSGRKSSLFPRQWVLGKHCGPPSGLDYTRLSLFSSQQLCWVFRKKPGNCVRCTIDVFKCHKILMNNTGFSADAFNVLTNYLPGCGLLTDWCLKTKAANNISDGRSIISLSNMRYVEMSVLKDFKKSLKLSTE